MEIFVILLVVGIGVAIAVTQSNRRKAAEAWKQAASELRINYNPGDFLTKPELYGKVRGCRVKITTRTKNQGGGSKKFTHYEVNYPQALRFGLSLTEQTAFSGLKKFLGAHDIEVGDPSFDDFVFVTSHDSARAREFLNPARRLYVRRMLSLYPGAEITDSWIRWDSKGLEDERSALVTNVKRMADFAVNMLGESANQQKDPFESAAANSSPVRPVDDLETVVTVTDQSEPPTHVVDSIPSVPIPLTIGVEANTDETTYTPRLDETHDDVEEPTETDRITPAAVGVPQEKQSGSLSTSGLDVNAVCHDLFCSGKISFQINEIFKQRYEGLEIHWSGKLTRVDSYPFDLVFGNEPGTKAEFEVAEIEGDPFGSDTVRAVVQLPAEAHDAMSPRTGETIAFAGTLVRCDSFMRLLFVADGKTVGR
jgi:hypothetical protein